MLTVNLETWRSFTFKLWFYNYVLKILNSIWVLHTPMLIKICFSHCSQEKGKGRKKEKMNKKEAKIWICACSQKLYLFVSENVFLPLKTFFSGKKPSNSIWVQAQKTKKTFLLYFATLFLLLLRLTFSCKNYDKSIFRLAFGASSSTQTLFEIHNNFAILELLYLSKIV